MTAVALLLPWLSLSGDEDRWLAVRVLPAVTISAVTGIGIASPGVNVPIPEPEEVMEVMEMEEEEEAALLFTRGRGVVDAEGGRLASCSRLARAGGRRPSRLAAARSLARSLPLLLLITK